jgi:hypothetical protein
VPVRACLLGGALVLLRLSPVAVPMPCVALAIGFVELTTAPGSHGGGRGGGGRGAECRPPEHVRRMRSPGGDDEASGAVSRTLQRLPQ